jgi:hypothetical protein
MPDSAYGDVFTASLGAKVRLPLTEKFGGTALLPHGSLDETMTMAFDGNAHRIQT